MNLNKLNNSIEEAERFLEKAKILKSELKNTYEIEGYNGRKIQCTPSCPKESGAVRRASMDLTRSLAELRK